MPEKKSKKHPNPGSDAAEREWRPVVGWEERYEVSSDGLVRSLNWEGHPGIIKVLKSHITKSPRNKVGYHVVRLHRGKKQFSKFVHRLVLEAFKGTPLERLEGNHIDGDTLNNRPENLEWCTSSENHVHAYNTGLSKPPPSQKGAGTQYQWRNIFDGRSFIGTPVSLSRHINGDAAYLYRVVDPNNQHHHSYRGWELEPGSASGLEKVRCRGKFKKLRRAPAALKL